MRWCLSNRADPAARQLADKHYNRQKPGTLQFAPTGSCVVFLSSDARAFWITSWPLAQFVKHAWPGAWINSAFRSEGDDCASEMIREAVSATRAHYGEAPSLGMITFVDPDAVPGVMVRGHRIYGFCYMKAGFEHVGFTKAGLWAWQLKPHEMPMPCRAKQRSVHGLPIFDGANLNGRKTLSVT